MSLLNHIDAILILTGLGFWFHVALRVTAHIAVWLVMKICGKPPRER